MWLLHVCHCDLATTLRPCLMSKAEDLLQENLDSFRLYILFPYTTNLNRVHTHPIQQLYSIIELKGDTDAVMMNRYMETETVSLPTLQSFKYLGSTTDRRGGATCRQQSGEGMVEMERTEWSDLRQESTNENESPHIPNSDSNDFV